MRGLVVGGPSTFVTRIIMPRLAAYGIEVVEHWNMEIRQVPDALPRGTQIVIILTDMLGHHISGRAQNLARASGVRVVRTQRKQAIFEQTMRSLGIEPIGPIPQEDDEPEDGPSRGFKSRNLLPALEALRQNSNLSNQALARAVGSRDWQAFAAARQLLTEEYTAKHGGETVLPPEPKPVEPKPVEPIATTSKEATKPAWMPEPMWMLIRSLRNMMQSAKVTSLTMDDLEGSITYRRKVTKLVEVEVDEEDINPID
jgi:hypothetical protein